MRLRPDSGELIEGSTKLLTFNLAPMAGANSFSSTPTITCADLTFASTAASGTTVTTLVSGGTAGRDYIVKITAPLSSGETEVGAITLEWKAAGLDDRAASA